MIFSDDQLQVVVGVQTVSFRHSLGEIRDLEGKVADILVFRQTPGESLLDGVKYTPLPRRSA